MTETNPAAARYLQRLDQELSAIPASERAEILREIADHIADSLAAGRRLDEVLTALGPADRLARGYAVELALNRPNTRLGAIDKALTVIGLVAVASLPSFIVSVILLSVGGGLAAAGLGVTGGGIVALVRPDLVPDLTVAPWVCLVSGPALAAAGAGILYVLFLYVRFLVHLTQRTVRRIGDGRTAR